MDTGNRPNLTNNAGGFDSTRWSLVLAAGDRDAPGAEGALEALCGTYWYPIYTFIRRRGHGAEEAADLTQGFFAKLLEKGSLGAADREKGRFRSFLLTVCKRFLANERDREHAQKRGGGRGVISFDAEEAERRYGGEPIQGLTPEAIYERRWAVALLEGVFGRLRDEFEGAGKGELYEAPEGHAHGRPAGPAVCGDRRAIGDDRGGHPGRGASVEEEVPGGGAGRGGGDGGGPGGGGGRNSGVVRGPGELKKSRQARVSSAGFRLSCRRSLAPETDPEVRTCPTCDPAPIAGPPRRRTSPRGCARGAS